MDGFIVLLWLLGTAASGRSSCWNCTPAAAAAASGRPSVCTSAAMSRRKPSWRSLMPSPDCIATPPSSSTSVPITSGVSHYLSSDQATMDTLRGSLAPCCQACASSRSKGHRRRLPLRTIRPSAWSSQGAAQRRPTETSAGLLAAVQPLGRNEHLLIRWTLQPGRAEQVPQTQDEHGRAIPSEHRRLLKLKNEGSVLRARGVVAVATAHPQRASHLLGRVGAVLRARSTAYGHLRCFRTGALLIAPCPRSPRSSPIATPPLSWPDCWPGRSTHRSCPVSTSAPRRC